MPNLQQVLCLKARQQQFESRCLLTISSWSISNARMKSVSVHERLHNATLALPAPVFTLRVHPATVVEVVGSNCSGYLMPHSLTNCQSEPTISRGDSTA